jgi:aryl-alcohol dehydrogenase-like predicted oxidoreductase
VLRSYEHGVNAFDTANVYSNGLSEVCLGKAIKALNLPREEIVVMTKVSYVHFQARYQHFDGDAGLIPLYRSTALSEKR